MTTRKDDFTLLFLAAPDDLERAKQDKAPLLELTYNWPDANGNSESYTGGRILAISPIE